MLSLFLPTWSRMRPIRSKRTFRKWPSKNRTSRLHFSKGFGFPRQSHRWQTPQKSLNYDGQFQKKKEWVSQSVYGRQYIYCGDWGTVASGLNFCAIKNIGIFYFVAKNELFNVGIFFICARVRKFTWFVIVIPLLGEDSNFTVFFQ